MAKKKIIPISFTTAAREYTFEMRAMKRSQHTINDYNVAFRHFERIMMGNPDICELARSDIVHFMAVLAEEKIAPNGAAPRPARRRSNKTIKNYLIALSALWTWAVAEGYASKHIVRQVQPPKPEKRQIVPYTDEEIVRMVKACRSSRAWHNKPLTESERHTSLRDQAIILLLLDTGARNSELRNLKMKHLDWEGNRITIRNGKGKKDRIVSFGNATRRALRRYMHQRPGEAKRRGNYLFVNMVRYKGHQISRGNLTKLIRRIADRAGVDGATVHRFRHTAAVKRLKNGMNVFQLKEFLGHASVQTCMKYVHIAELEMEDVMRRSSPVDNLRL